NKLRLARRFGKISNTLKTILYQEFWDAEQEAFFDGIKDDAPIPHHYPISSAWPLLFDLVEPEHKAGIRRLMQQKLAHIGTENRKRMATPYGGFYLLLALGQEEMAGVAEQFIRQNWGPMIDRHDDTAWENFGDEGNGTLSHAWSGGPTYYLTSQLLGVEMGYPNPLAGDTLVIAPVAETVDWAEGHVPLSQGMLYVRWEVVGQKLLLRYQAPAKLPVKVAPRGRLGNLELVLTKHPALSED
ncbi:MAG: hypothetical protein AAFV07_16475, partial [Bacteroidota bacterium]